MNTRTTLTSLVALLPLGMMAAGTTYELDSDASMQQGCFEICACPISLYEIAGGFELTPLDGDEAIWSVSGLSWTVGSGTNAFAVVGSGTYERAIDGEQVQQRLQLDLVVGDEVEDHFDSGWVAAEAPWPAIDVTVSLNQLQACWDRLFVVDAVPTGPGATTHPADVDESGIVDVNDLVQVILEWGPCPAGAAPCPCDVNEDGVVGVDDLVRVIVSWGAP